MEKTFQYIQIVLALILTFVILLQVKGLGSGFFGNAYATSFKTRRGFERTLFRGTILLSIAFVAVAIVSARIV